MANITSNNFNDIDLRVSKSEYFDFIISKENDPTVIYNGTEFYDDSLISFINLDDSNCISGDKIYSTNRYKWVDARNDGLILNNIGLTGIDNGFITFNDTISSNDFCDILTGSSLSIITGDTRLVLNLITGNTGEFIYPTEYVEDLNNCYVSLNGGFYQGFFKSGENYSILPEKIGSELCFEVLLKPTNHGIVLPGTLNEKYPENKGMFLYIGTRSENKFWYEYLKEDLNKFSVNKTGQTNPLLNNIEINTYDGFNTKLQNIYNINTDNKYLLFNRTAEGYSVHSDNIFDENSEYYITGRTNENVNLYLNINRTPTGYSTASYDTIPNMYKPYNVVSDITRNAIGFRITDDGRIGYRMINESCDNEDGFVVDEEYSDPNIFTNDNLAYITIRMIMNSPNEYNTEDRNFKMLFYVDSKLKFISKYLPELKFRNLSDSVEKQEGTPFNISLGGGSQGLSEMIGFNDSYSTRYLLPIEKYFAGSFIGNIYKLRIYNGKMDYTKIRNNYIYSNEYTPGHIDPSVVFFINIINISSPETNYKREIGNISSILNANVTLNEEHYPITGYKFYYYLNDIDNKIQINGLFPVDPLRPNIINYTHNDSSLSISGITSIKYEIEVFDVYNIHYGVKSTQTILFDYMIFYGTTNIVPTGSTEIRLLSNKLFSNDTSTIELNTGTINKTFVIAIPSNNKKIDSVVDTNAYNVDITNSFIKKEMYVKDAGEVDVLYDIYTMINAIPYSKNHKLLITLN